MQSFGLNLASQETAKLLHNFFNWREEEEKGQPRAAAKLILARHFHTLLEDVADFFRERQRLYNFYASSLLFLYDYDLIGRLSEEEVLIGEEVANHVRLKLIDFAHVFPAAEGREDENFLYGVENLRDIFHQFLLTHDGEHSS